MATEEGLRARGAAGKKEKEAEEKNDEKQLSVIVPTYNEVDNIRPLCERLFKAVVAAGIKTELFIVDDESVGSKKTEAIVKELQKEGYAVRIHCRKKVEGRGLSSAVLLGFDGAKYTTLLCMDADLQHEPESVPAVARPVMDGEAEFTVGSRHVAGGGLGFDWSMFRQVVSQGATLLAWPLGKSTDPMSGFFCTTTEVLKRGRDTINPIGFKIGLEVMVRCECQKVQDVGITFRERLSGESKLSAKQYRFYLMQLASLYWFKYQAVIYLFVFICIALVNFYIRFTDATPDKIADKK